MPGQVGLRNVDDVLYRQVKTHSFLRGVDISVIVNEAFAFYLESHPLELPAPKQFQEQSQRAVETKETRDVLQDAIQKYCIDDWGFEGHGWADADLQQWWVKELSEAINARPCNQARVDELNLAVKAWRTVMRVKETDDWNDPWRYYYRFPERKDLRSWKDVPIAAPPKHGK